jgi:hypothetical protein
MLDREEKQKYKKLLKVSYGSKKIPEGFTVDRKLSGKRVSVLTNQDHTKNYVVHRGTASVKDWVTDFKMALGYEGGNRFKHSARIQKKAEKKYGRENIETVGHSLGGRLAEKYGKKSSKVVTFNKAVTPRSIMESYMKPRKNQFDIRTKNDPVSALHKYERKANKTEVLSGSKNPVKTHVLSSLK